MLGATLLLIGLLPVGAAEYKRPLGAKALDQATLDAEGYGEKKAFQREDGGLRITLAPGEKETGWKTPQALRIGGDFTIVANLVVARLPKPAQEDGAAVGVAIAFQSADQPDATLVRVIEPDGSDVYRPIERTGNNPMQMQVQMQMRMGGFPQPGAKPPKPPRRTFPASGAEVRIEIRREGGIIRYQVADGTPGPPRYLGQSTLGTNDVAAVKLFASNRNGAEGVNLLVRDLTIRADRITGLGTTVRDVFGKVIYADPTAIEGDVLVLGGPPKTPPGGPNPAAGPAPVPGGGPASPKPASPAPPPPAVAPPAPPPPAGAVPAAPVMILAGNLNGNLQPIVPPAPRPAAPGPPPGTAQPPPSAVKKDPVKMPLDELESIRFERTPALAARVIGQPNLDFTGPGAAAKEAEAKAVEAKPGAPEAKKADAADDVLAPPPGTAEAAPRVARVEPKPNGIRDLHLALANLRDAAITQVTVHCQTDKGPAGWRIDTSNSKDSPLVLRRSGTEPWADLFLEPPAGDCHQKDFTIAVTYADGQPGNATAKANIHTDPKLAIDPDVPGAPPANAWIHLSGEEKIFGRIERIDEETLRLMTSWQEALDVPLSHVAGIHFGLVDRKESPESFAKRLKARGAEDVLLARTKGGEVIAIPGIVEGTDGDRLHFRYQDRSRTLPLAQVEGLVMASRQEPTKPEVPSQTYTLPGAVVSGRWKEIDAATWKVETAWGQALKLPAPEIQAVRSRGGKVVYLSDLEPSRVEETPFFGLKLPWRRDVGLLGEPLKMNGQAVERGLAVHSRCVLTYDLDGRYATFEARVGFDEASNRKGRVDCRVLADGKELYANPDLRADGPPVPLALPVSGVRQLILRVDFGPGQDTGDRVIWADARLFREGGPRTQTALAR